MAVLMVCAVVWCSPAIGDSTTVESGHSAAWFNPDRNGEGLVLEILPAQRALLYWFTYDESGNPRWLAGVGNVLSDQAGEYLEFPELLVTHGGRFGPNFDPTAVVRETVGTAQLRFSDCDNATFTYAAFNQAQSFPMQRLSQTMAADCTSINGVPGFPVQDYAGQNGSWYDPEHDGEGFAMAWLQRNQALVYWFSYDPDGNQYWMYGVGEFQDGAIVFSKMYSSRGPKFGEDFDPVDVEGLEWGSLTLELDCNGGSASYLSTIAEFGSGNQALTRLTFLDKPACPWVKPKLTDLYEFTWTEIPIAPSSVSDPNNIQAESIADDGTVVAHWLQQNSRSDIAVWRPSASEWQKIPGLLAAAGAPVLISPNGDSILANEAIEADPGVSFQPVTWTDELGWLKISNLVLDEAVLTGASEDRSVLLGTGRKFGDPALEPWKWDAVRGQMILPETKNTKGATPTAASNDGSIVAGFHLRFVEGALVPIRVGIRWKSDDNPKLLRDHLGADLGPAFGCNSTCKIIIGSLQAEPAEDYPYRGQAWFWGEAGRFGYLGKISDSTPGTEFSPIVPTDISADGSMIVGSYSVEQAANELGSRGFIWTQNTGIESVRLLLQELGLGDDDWHFMIAYSISSTGNRILLAGDFDSPTLHRRAVILGLNPKEK